MKLCKLLIFLLISSCSYGQYYTNVIAPTKWTKGGFDSLFIPQHDTTRPGDITKAWIVLKGAVLYRWNTTDLKFDPISSGEGGGSYTLPIADTNILGGIKVGNDLTINRTTGTLNINPLKSAYWNTVGLMATQSALNDSMAIARGLIPIIRNWLFDGTYFDTSTTPGTVTLKDFVSAELEPYAHGLPAATLTPTDVANVEDLLDTALHPSSDYVRLMIKLAKDTTYFHPDDFYGLGTFASPMRIKLTALNGYTKFQTDSAIAANFAALTTTSVAEGTNLYYTNTRSRSAISLTTTGTSGAATYNSSTGVLNIPSYAGGVTSFNGRTGAITPQLSDYSAYFAALSHTHAISDVTGLQTALDNKIDSATVAIGTDQNTLVNWKNGTQTARGFIPKHEDGLDNGGVVTSAGGLALDVTKPYYYLNGLLYTAAATTVTLATADATLDRKDIVVADNTGAIVVLQGTPSAAPIEPQPNPDTQIQLAEIDVNAGATTLNGVTTTPIYNENIEWTTSAGVITIDPNNTTAPYNGSKDISTGAWTDGNTVNFTNGSTVLASSFTTFKFFLRLKAAMASTSGIAVRFFNGNTAVSSSISILNYGLNKATVGVYQNISIPISAFGITGPFNKIQIRFAGTNASGCYIDYVQLQSGTPTAPTPVSNYVTSNKASNDSLYYIANGKPVFFYKVSASGGGSISRTTRGDSLAVGTTKVKDRDNPDNSPFYLRNNMRWLEYYLNNVYTGTGNFSFGFLGDSKTALGTITNAFMDALEEKITMNGPGLIPADGSFLPPHAANTGSYPAFSGANWTLKTFSTGGTGITLHSTVSTGSSTAFGFTKQTQYRDEYDKFTNIDVWYKGQASGGTFTVSVDGVLKATINTSSTTGFQKTAITGLTDSTHSVLITPISSNAEFYGINCYRTGVFGMKFHKIGQFGAKASNYLTADTSLWNPQFRELSPNLLAIYLGTNNRGAQQPLDSFKMEINSLIAKVKALNSSMDICLIGQTDMGPTPFGGAALYTTKQYNDVLRQLAIEDSTAYFDIDQLASDYATNSKKVWLSDGTHEGNYAGYNIATNFVNGIQAFNKVNFSDQYRKAFLNSSNNLTASIVNPVQTANRVIVSDGNGLIGTNTNFTFNGTALTLTNVNLSATGTSTGSFGGGVSGGTSPYTSSGSLRIGLPSSGSALGNIGYFGFSQGADINSAGYTAGIRMDGTHGTVKFQNTNQSAPADNWVFGNFAGVGATRGVSASGNYIRVNQGIDNFNGNFTWNFLGLDPVINQTNYIASNAKLRGIYWNPTLTSSKDLIISAFANETGDNHLNITSGSTAIGVAEGAISNAAILQINSTTKGLLPPRMTQTQRDALGASGIQSVTMSTFGSSYAAAPTVSFTGGGGTGATGTAVMLGTVVVKVTITNPGHGYTSAPTVVFTPTSGGSGAAGTAVLNVSDGLTIYCTDCTANDASTGVTQTYQISSGTWKSYW